MICCVHVSTHSDEQQRQMTLLMDTLAAHPELAEIIAAAVEAGDQTVLEQLVTHIQGLAGHLNIRGRSSDTEEEQDEHDDEDEADEDEDIPDLEVSDLDVAAMPFDGPRASPPAGTAVFGASTPELEPQSQQESNAFVAPAGGFSLGSPGGASPSSPSAAGAAAASRGNRARKMRRGRR